MGRYDCDDPDLSRGVIDRISQMTPEQLGAEWVRQCCRHDNAVDRCEEINSPTIVDAAWRMELVEREFDQRGLNRSPYVDAAWAVEEARFAQQHQNREG